jgi:hypothetical protein
MNEEVRVTPNASDAIVASWHAMRARPALLFIGVAFFVVLPWCAASA